MRLVNAFAAIVLAFAGGVLPAPGVGIADAGLLVNATPADHGLLSPGEDLSITVTVTNESTEDLAAGEASLYLDRTVLSTQKQVQDWFTEPEAAAATPPGRKVGTAEFPAIDVGETRSVTIDAPADRLGLGVYSSWGPRGVTVDLSVDGESLSRVRGAIVWHPDGTDLTAKITVVAPITAPADPSGLIPADLLAEYTSPTGLLTDQLDALADQPVALGIDPMIIASIRVLGDAAPASAVQWLDRLSRVANETFPLAYADADIAAASQAGQASPPAPIGFPIDSTLFPPPPTSTASPSGEPVPSPSASSPAPGLAAPESILDWSYTLQGVAWPRPDTVRTADLEVFAKNGVTNTIVSDSNVTAGSTADARGAADGHDILVANTLTSTLLNTAASAPTDSAWQQATTQLLSMLAVMTAQPGQQRQQDVLMVLDRSAAPSEARLAQTLDALHDVPWVEGSPLDELVSQPGSVMKLTDQPEDPQRIETVKELFASEAEVAEFASALNDPELITSRRRLALLALLSQSSDSTGPLWTEDTAGFLDQSKTIMSSVGIADSSSISLWADHTSLPVLVSNELAYPVTVYVHVRAMSPILNIEDHNVKLTIEPASQKRALVPVQSVANGQVTLEVTLTSGTGVKIGTTTRVDINVQAGWETAFTVVVASLLVLIFGFGFWRNISRGRRAKRALAEEGSAPGPSDEATTSGGSDE